MSRRERQRRRGRHKGRPVLRATIITVIIALCAAGLGVAGAVGWVVSVAQSADLNQLKPRLERLELDRLHARRQAPGLHLLARPAHAGHPAEDAAQPAPRDRRDRGPPLLRPQGHRLRGRDPRRRAQHHEQEDGAGRLDADDAARPQHLPDQRALQEVLRAQDPRGQARPGAREAPPGPQGQGVDPHQVPELRPVRHRGRPDRRRRAGRGAHVLRQARLPAHAGPVRADRRPAAGALRVQPVPRLERRAQPPRRGPQRDGQGRVHHPRRGGRRGARRSSASSTTASTRRAASSTSSTTSPTELFKRYGRQDRPPRRPEDLDHARPQRPEAGARRDRRPPEPAGRSRPRRSSRSTRATATSSPWPPRAPTARRSSTTPPRPIASPARRSR